MTRLFPIALLAIAMVGLLFLVGCGGGDSGPSPTVIVAPTPSVGPPFRYRVTEIAKLPYIARFVAVNRNGYVIGNRYDPDSRSSDGGFIVSPDGAITRVPDREGFPRTRVSGINSHGKVVGSISRGGLSPEADGFVYDLRTGNTSVSEGLRSPTSINDFGKVAGLVYPIDPASGIRESIVRVYNTASGTFEDVTRSHGDTFFQTTVGITNDGWIVAADEVLRLYNLDSKARRTIRPAGVYEKTHWLSVADRGKVSGVDSTVNYDVLDLSSIQPFIYDIASDVKTYLPAFPMNWFNTVYFPLNNAGTAAFGSTDGSYVYREGRVQELGSTLSAEDQAKWKIRYPFALDDSGAIYTACERKAATDAAASTYLVLLTPQ